MQRSTLRMSTSSSIATRYVSYAALFYNRLRNMLAAGRADDLRR